MVLPLFFAIATVSGDARPIGEASAESMLGMHFPLHASRVLGAHSTSRFYHASDGIRSSGTAARGLRVRFPHDGGDAVQFELPSGQAVQIQEQGVHGTPSIKGGSLEYRHAAGAALWTTLGQSYEEWIVAEAVPGSPVSRWSVRGAQPRQAGDAVELLDRAGLVAMRVTAPEAYAENGNPLPVRLTAEQHGIAAYVDATVLVLVDPNWTAVGSMGTARESHTATLLPNGKVLVVGGWDGADVVASAELCDPTTRSWAPAGIMAEPRIFHTATLLANGKVLVAGGFTGVDYTASVGLYDPAGETWQSAGNLLAPRGSDGRSCYDHDACSQLDTCQSGICTESDPMVCEASDSCHEAGVCSASTGLCPNPSKPDGAACDDGDACTKDDGCTSTPSLLPSIRRSGRVTGQVPNMSLFDALRTVAADHHSHRLPSVTLRSAPCSGGRGVLSAVAAAVTGGRLALGSSRRMDSV